MNGTATRRAPSPSSPEWTPQAVWSTESSVVSGWPTETKSRQSRASLARQASYVAIDFVLVCFAGFTAFWLRFGLAHATVAAGLGLKNLAPFIAPRMYLGYLLLYAALIVLACTSYDLYRTAREQTSLEESLTAAKAVALATALLALFIFISGHKEISRVVVASAGMGNLIVLAGWRYAKRRYVLRRALRGEGISRVLIVGAGKVGKALAAWLEENRQLGYAVCGFLDPHPNGDRRVLGSVTDLRNVALAHFADQLIVTLPADRETVKEIFLEARRLRLSLKIVPDLYDGLGWRAPVQSIGGFPVMELHGQPIPVLGLAAKRAIDLIGALLGLALTSPLLLLAALWIRRDSPGPIFYSALRVGKKGRKFRCHKLRTMVAEAETQKECLRCANERAGPFFKIKNDPRITRCGRWLRKISIDELPQLVNVLCGEMSLVGPRPHPVDDFERYSLEHLRRLDVKPGVTGLWQVTSRHDPSFEASMKLDLEYIENWSLWLDVKILARTVPEVFRASGS